MALIGLFNPSSSEPPTSVLTWTSATGFSHAGVPRISADLIGLITSQLPAIFIILVIEHIAIAKSLGRLNGYKVCASQEILSQGASNIVASFVGGYPGTGSFGASGVLSKTGVRSPMVGVFSAIVLVLALYVLTGVFFFIPKAALAALIIHAVSNLMASPSSIVKYARLSPLELLIWIAGVVLAIFKSLDISMYVTIALSAVLLLVRLSRSRGSVMGSVKVQDVCPSSDPGCGNCEDRRRSGAGALTEDELQIVDCCLASGQRQIFVPLDRRDGSNPRVEVDEVYPGIIVYRFPEGFNYTNYAHHMEDLESHVIRNTRRTAEAEVLHPSVRSFHVPVPSSILMPRRHVFGATPLKTPRTTPTTCPFFAPSSSTSPRSTTSTSPPSRASSTSVRPSTPTPRPTSWTGTSPVCRTAGRGAPSLSRASDTPQKQP